MPIDALTVNRADGDSPDKRQEILDVAASFFLSYGFEGASVNAMARHSGISKESFYRYFRGKEELFTAVLDQELAGYQRGITAITEHWNEEDMRETLRKVAHTMLTVLMSDRQRALRQLVFNEVRRNPEIGAHYYRIGPTVAYDSLEAYFSLHAAESDFEPRYLARAFLALLLHDLTLARNCGMRGELDAKEMAARVDAAVDPFIKAYFRSPA